MEPSKVEYKPKWKVDVGSGCELGISIDDGCFLVLYLKENSHWKPGKLIPPAVAIKLGNLTNELSEN